MSSQLELSNRIAILEEKNRKLRKQLDDGYIAPKVQAELYGLAKRGELFQLQFKLTGFLSNAAWKLVDRNTQADV